MDKTAIITGVGGQDGSYLSELLLEKDYLVVGVNRRVASRSDWRIKHLKANPNFILESGDVTDQGSIQRLVEKWQPDEFYNLAAMSFVKESWNTPFNSLMVTGGGVTNCLEALRNVKRDTKFYQASSSEMFGKVQEPRQKETTPFYPRSPYGAAKLYGYWITRNYRESYDMFTCNGILFNHESSRRGIEFVTRKITDGAARIKLGLQDKLGLGNIEAKRDWGHAIDYMAAAHLMMQHDEPDDFVISTGIAHSIKDLLDIAFGELDLDWRKHVYQDKRYWRPAEVDVLLGDSSKARRILGWKPEYDFETLIKEMVQADLERVKNG